MALLLTLGLRRRGYSPDALKKFVATAGLINAARGGVVDELSLIKSLDSGKLAFAGVDTFENEPTPSIKLLMNPRVSITPHIGAATTEAQNRIGIELANQIISLVK